MCQGKIETSASGKRKQHLAVQQQVGGCRNVTARVCKTDGSERVCVRMVDFGALLVAAISQYFADEGKGDALTIGLPKGGYVPVLSAAPPAESPKTKRSERRLRSGIAFVLLAASVAGVGWIRFGLVGREKNRTFEALDQMVPMGPTRSGSIAPLEFVALRRSSTQLLG